VAADLESLAGGVVVVKVELGDVLVIAAVGGLGYLGYFAYKALTDPEKLVEAGEDAGFWDTRTTLEYAQETLSSTSGIAAWFREHLPWLVIGRTSSPATAWRGANDLRELWESILAGFGQVTVTHDSTNDVPGRTGYRENSTVFYT